MPRQIRIEFEGANYHVMARGNRRENIYCDNEDRKRFLRYLREACGRTGWQVRAWVLMSNHYHLALHTPEANLVEGMRWLQNAYTRYFNTRHRLWGHLFGGRYKSVLVESGGSTGEVSRSAGYSESDYLTTLIDYIHLNPARAGLLDASRGESVLDYPWSSVAAGYGCAPSKRENWLDVEIGLSLLQLNDTVAGRRHYVERLDERIQSEAADRLGLVELEGQTLQSTLRRGWYWGSERFREKMISLLGRESAMNNRNYRTSEQGRDHSVAMAEGLVKEGIELMGIEREAHGKLNLRRGDLRRAALAWAIWKRTSVPQKWIADHLEMKSPANVSQQVRRFDALPARRLSGKIREWKRRILKIVD